MLTIGEFARLGQVSPRMLRHYDETGLLTPAQTDPQTGYRFYDVTQLTRLHRLVALRELGFGLGQIRPLLDEELPTVELRGMLRMRKAQIEQNLAAEQTRLRRIEAHLRALERGQIMELRDASLCTSDSISAARRSARRTSCASSACPRSRSRRTCTGAPWRTSPRPSRP